MTAALRKLGAAAYLFISLNTYAQYNDYVVTTAHDTLRGKITSMAAEVKIKGEDRKKTTVSNVQSVYTNWFGEQKTLYPVMLSSEVVYLDRLEEGKITLYEKVDILPKGGYAYYYYAQKDTGDLKLVSVRNVIFSNKKKQKESLAALLSDQQAVADEFLKEKENRIEVVRRYVKEYNKNWRYNENWVNNQPAKKE